jgi:hypothetical protein
VTVTAAVLAKASSDNVTPGVLGFLVVAGIGVALYFLLRSMNKQFRKLPPPPPDEDGDASPSKPLSPLQAAAARRREAAAAEKSAGRSPDAPDRLR